MPSIISELAVVLIADDTGFIRASSNAAKSLETLALESEQYQARISESMAMAGAKMEQAMARAAKANEALGVAMQGPTVQAQRWSDAFGKVANAGKYAGIALLALGGYSIDAASKFQAAMELIHTQAGASQDEVNQLSQAVLALAPTVGIGPDKLADGLFHVESAGFRGQQAMDILTMAAHNAATGMSDMEDASQAMVGSMAVGFKDVRDAADAAAYLNRIVGIGDMRMQQLSSAIATGVMPTFKEAGLGMTDFGAALATLTDNVTPANQAATRLRMTIALLGAPSKAAFKALEAVGLGADEANKALGNRAYLEKYGISISQLSEDLQKPDGLLVAVKDLNTHLQGLDPTAKAAVIERAFGGGRTSAAIQTLLSQQDRLESKYVALGTSATRAKEQQEAWAQTQKTFQQQSHELGASLQVVAIQLGTKLMPPLTKFFEYLTAHKPALYAFFATLLIFLGLMTAAFIAAGIAALIASWEILVIVAGIAILAIAIYLLITHWRIVWKFIKDIAMDVWHALVVAWNATIHALAVAVDWVKTYVVDPVIWFFKLMAHEVMNAVRFLEEIPHFFMEFVARPFIRDAEMVADFFVAVWHGAVAVVMWVVNNIFKPIARFAWNYLLIPFRIILDILIFVFKFVWGFMSVILKDFWENVVRPTAHQIADAWRSMVDQIKHWFDLWWTGMKVIGDWIVHTFWDGMLKPAIHVIEEAWGWLVNQIKIHVDQWMAIFHAAWQILVSLWHNIDNGFIQPLWNGIKYLVMTNLKNAWDNLQSALAGLQRVWEQVWGGVKTAVSDAWDFIKGIFDKIMGGIRDVKKAFDGFESALKGLNPSQLGKDVAHILGFAEGGIVPGPTGAPRLAVVHGGEYVLNTGQVSAIRSAGTTLIRSPSMAAAAYSAGGGDSTVIVNVDGKQLFQVIIPYAQRHKLRNNSTFLT